MQVRQRLCALGNRDQAREMFKYIRGKKGTENELFDLNKVAPMPRTIRQLLKLSAPEAIAAARATPEALQRYTERQQTAMSRAWIDTGLDDAAEWMETYWGSARNVWGVDFIETVRAGEPDARLFFYSCKPIFPIVRELSNRFGEVLLELTFADQGEEFVGVAHYASGRGLCKEADWYSERGDKLRARLWEHPEDDVVEEGMLVN